MYLQFRSYQILTNQDFNIRLVDVKNEKNNGFLAGVSLPPSSRAPRVSLAPKAPVPKTPFPFPFKRLPRRLGCLEAVQQSIFASICLKLWRTIPAKIHGLNFKLLI